MKIIEAVGELKAMKPYIESSMSVVGYDAYDMAIRSLELWDTYAEDVDDVYEDGKGETYLIREWIEDGGETTETVKPTAESSQNVSNDDLVSRKAAIDKFTVASNQDGAYGYLDAKSAVGLLNDLPSAKPEIIRCKDCRWWGYDDETGDLRVCHAAKHCYISSRWEISIRRTHRGDYYCADAERRTDEETDIS